MDGELTLVVRGATIVDGTGALPYEADIGIVGDRIVQVGRDIRGGAREIDAVGHMVTPGFVDIHTHYDGQATWSDRIDPSSGLGVTTVVTGNCGVGFAPCRPTDHDTLVRLMEGVEDIPEVVMTAGLSWQWESFPDYLALLRRRHYDIDVAVQIGHAPLRVYVMGERGINRETATAADREQMARLAAEAVRAGALGFSTSRTILHKTSDGKPTPMFDAAEEELTAIAKALAEVGTGVVELVSDFDDPEQECALYRRIAENSGRPLSLALTQREDRPDTWRRVLGLVAEANDAGVPLSVQVATRGIGVMMGLELTRHPFSWHPTYRRIAHLPLPERLRQMRDPAVRQAILTEAPADPAEHARNVDFARMFPVEAVPDYEPTPAASIAGVAARLGLPPADVAYDMLTEGDGKRLMYRPLHNYVSDNLDVVHAMLNDTNTLIGLGDGGAHCGIISDSSFDLFMLTHWARDRRRGPRLSIEAAVRMVTSDPARAVGLHDRGVVAPGYKADLNIIDFDRLRLLAPQVAYDLPAGGRRLVQHAEGIAATIVSGTAIAYDGKPTGATPGRLVSGVQPAPR